MVALEETIQVNKVIGFDSSGTIDIYKFHGKMKMP